MKTEKRKIQIRLTEAEHAELAARAKQEGKTVTRIATQRLTALPFKDEAVTLEQALSDSDLRVMYARSVASIPRLTIHRIEVNLTLARYHAVAEHAENLMLRLAEYAHRQVTLEDTREHARTQDELQRSLRTRHLLTGQ